MSLPRRWNRSASPSRLFAAKLRRSSGKVAHRHQATFRSPPVPRRCSNCHCAKRCSSVTTTSAPSTSCSGSFAKAKGSPLRFSSSSALTFPVYASRSFSCSAATQALVAVLPLLDHRATRPVQPQAAAVATANPARLSSTSSAAISPRSPATRVSTLLLAVQKRPNVSCRCSRDARKTTRYSSVSLALVRQRSSKASPKRLRRTTSQTPSETSSSTPLTSVR